MRFRHLACLSTGSATLQILDAQMRTARELISHGMDVLYGSASEKNLTSTIS